MFGHKMLKLLITIGNWGCIIRNIPIAKVLLMEINIEIAQRQMNSTMHKIHFCLVAFNAKLEELHLIRNERAPTP